MSEVTSDIILNYLKKLVAEKIPVAREQWLDMSFKLNLLRIDEAELFHKMQQGVAQKKLQILKTQDKRNVAAAELEVESSDEYRFMRDQESKIDAIDQFIQISKKSADIAF